MNVETKACQYFVSFQCQTNFTQWLVVVDIISFAALILCAFVMSFDRGIKKDRANLLFRWIVFTFLSVFYSIYVTKYFCYFRRGCHENNQDAKSLWYNL